jgi:hypothetical protein
MGASEWFRVVAGVRGGFMVVLLLMVRFLLSVVESPLRDRGSSSVWRGFNGAFLRLMGGLPLG